MKNKMLAKALTILAFVIPPLIMAGVIIFRAHSRDLLVANFNHETKSLAAQWTNYDYIPITYSNSAFPDSMKKLVVDSTKGLPLSREQGGQLILEQLIFLRAYSEGTYEAYRAFRIPPGVSPIWTNSQLGSLGNILTNYLRLPPVVGAASLPFDKRMKAFLVAMSGDGTVYSNLFVGICFNQSRMVVAQYSNSVPKIGAATRLPANFPKLAGEAGQLFGVPNFVSQKELSTFIRFSGDSIGEIQKQFGSVVVADSYYFVKYRNSGSVLPVILRVYWDPKLNRWLPDDLALWGRVIAGGYTLPVF